ncbi:profilin, required for normal timing of actin polymerization in response to thermal stress [Cadophora gregata f. sp. sojae]|nr:profilin, required for normal timing of actin polymerization in response to thermal stress [Cadophora gregata f. sp. sojae]
MSWQAYVDSSMVASGHVDKGAIYSIAGDSKWAASPNFDVSATEMKEIINGLSGKVDALYAEGLHVGGERYVLTKAEDRSLYARKVVFFFLNRLRYLDRFGSSQPSCYC